MNHKYDKEKNKDYRVLLSLSNKELWASLSEVERDLVVNECVASPNINEVGLRHVLDRDRSFRINAITLILGVFIGLFANFAYRSLERMIGVFQNGFIDASISVAFIVFIWWYFRQIRNSSAETFADYGVLEYLVKKIKQ